MQGNMLLRADRTDEAQKVFEFMTNAFPKSCWGYLALGGVYKNAGRISLAKEQFNKALEVDPGNVHARAFLSELESD